MASVALSAKAPGKVVLSGAYVVLQGAPALVSAVDRYAVASNGQASDFITEEVQAAIDLGYLEIAPSFNADALREDDRKLGLGSSAAILVASLACEPPSDPKRTRDLQHLFEAALLAHRKAQGGGSGIDVASSTFGGTLRYQLPEVPRGTPLDEVKLLETQPRLQPVCLPDALHLEIWASPEAASTREFLMRVSGAQRRDPEATSEVFDELWSAARAASDAVLPPTAVEKDAASDRSRAEHFLAALERQFRGLSELGRLANIPICTSDLKALHDAARTENAVLLPAGAGGGDIALYASLASPSLELQKLCKTLKHRRLRMALSAQGVQQI